MFISLPHERQSANLLHSPILTSATFRRMMDKSFQIIPHTVEKILHGGRVATVYDGLELG